MKLEVGHNEQQATGPGAPWTGWRPLGGAGQRAKSLTVVAGPDKRLHAFRIGMDDQVGHNEQEVAQLGGPWTGWRVLSGAGNQGKSLTVVADQDGRLHAFKIGLDDQISHSEQVATGLGAPWTGWRMLGEAGNRAKSLVVAASPGGRLHAFRIGLDDEIGHNEQVSVCLNAPWTGWRPLSTTGDQAASLVVVPDQDGRIHVFSVDLTTAAG